MVKRLEELFEIVKTKEKRTVAVAAAHDSEVLKAVTEAASMGIADAILVGDKEKIISIADEEKISIENMEIVDEKDNISAALKAVELVTTGRAQFLMKGMLNTSELLKAVLNKQSGLKKEGLLSHVMVYQIPSYHKLLILTDGGMVPYPELNDKINIINNSVKVANVLGIENPKVAAVCAVESVNPSMQATVDAAILAQMNKRGQIKNCTVDGPLALDNAISKESAVHKGIISSVSGETDIVLVPNIESGNLLGKSLTYFAKAENAGIIVGAKCPIVLVSRADSSKSKLYSIALAALMGE